jgi:hypothetical protein
VGFGLRRRNFLASRRVARARLSCSANWNTDDWKTYLVPLLAVPQLTHYVLDGFVWKGKNNENFRLIG